MNRVGGFAVQSKEPTLIHHSHRLPERCGLGSKMRRTRVEHILSALPPLATEERTFGIGSSVPEADSCTATKPFARVSLLDHPVRGGEQGRRYGQVAATGDCTLP